MTWGSNGNAERKLKARLRAEGRPCHICGQPIDYSLPPGGLGAARCWTTRT